MLPQQRKRLPPRCKLLLDNSLSTFLLKIQNLYHYPDYVSRALLLSASCTLRLLFNKLIIHLLLFLKYIKPCSHLIRSQRLQDTPTMVKFPLYFIPFLRQALLVSLYEERSRFMLKILSLWILREERLYIFHKLDWFLAKRCMVSLFQ